MKKNSVQGIIITLIKKIKMGFFLLWLTFTVICGYIGSGRKIGFFTAFVIALLLSPLIGFIVVFNSTKLEDLRFNEKIMDENQKQTEILKNLSDANIIEQYHNLLQKGIITQVEFDEKKKVILNNEIIDPLLISQKTEIIPEFNPTEKLYDTFIGKIKVIHLTNDFLSVNDEVYINSEPISNGKHKLGSMHFIHTFDGKIIKISIF